MEVKFDNIKTYTNDVPALFDKKYKSISDNALVHVTNITGETRHYTPAAQE